MRKGQSRSGIWNDLRAFPTNNLEHPTTVSFDKFLSTELGKTRRLDLDVEAYDRGVLSATTRFVFYGATRGLQSIRRRSDVDDHIALFPTMWNDSEIKRWIIV